VDFFGTALMSGGYTVSGYCYGFLDAPLSDVYVYLYYNGTIYYSACSDSNGYFAFNNVPSAYYELFAEKDAASLNIGDGSTTKYTYYPLNQDRFDGNFYQGAAPSLPSEDFRIWNNAFNPKNGGYCLIKADWQQPYATVKVYDAAGRMVKTWDVSDTGSGVSWDGRDRSGAIVANGIYFVHIECGSIKKAHPVMIKK